MSKYNTGNGIAVGRKATDLMTTRTVHRWYRQPLDAEARYDAEFIGDEGAPEKEGAHG